MHLSPHFVLLPGPKSPCNAPPHHLRLGSRLLPLLPADLPPLLPLLPAAHLLCLVHRSHPAPAARADPPPPPQEALPQDDRPHQPGEPHVFLLSGDVQEVQPGAHDSEGERRAAKGGGAAVRAPRLAAIDQEAPDEEGGGEEEGEGGVADVAHGGGDDVDGGAFVDGEELHYRCDDCQGAKEGEYEAAFEAGWVEEG